MKSLLLTLILPLIFLACATKKEVVEETKTLKVYNLSGRNWVRKTDCQELFNSNVESFPIERPSIALEYEDELEPN